MLRRGGLGDDPRGPGVKRYRRHGSSARDHSHASGLIGSDAGSPAAAVMIVGLAAHTSWWRPQLPHFLARGLHGVLLCFGSLAGTDPDSGSLPRPLAFGPALKPGGGRRWEWLS